MNKHSFHKRILNSFFCIKERRYLWLLFIFFLACSFIDPPPQDETNEYGIKAAFIYKFTNYIDWDQQFQGNEFVIGIVGSSPIKDQLTEIARTQTVKDKKIVVRQFKKLDEITSCQILFISQQTSLSLREILTKVNARGTLTISEKEGYAKKGTQINFIEMDNKLKFEANPKSISAAGLKASSQLLRLAVIVE